MADRRAARIVWAFLIGVTTIEGWATWISFRDHGMAGLLRYVATPPAAQSAWIAAACVAILYVGYTASQSAVVREKMLRPSRWRGYVALRLVAIPMALVTGFFEEAFFRKTLMDLAAHHGAAAPMQIALSALAFGAVHAVWGVFARNFRGALGAMLTTSGLGAALGIVYVLGGRSIGPCIAAHIAINLLIEPWLIVTAATNGWRRSTPKLA